MMTAPKEDFAETLLNQALLLAASGFHVFPLIPNGKIPAVGAWQHKATTDANIIRAMWTRKDPVMSTEYVEPFNIGVCCGLPFGDGFISGLDVDVKKNKGGAESLAMLEDLYGALGETFTVDTPTGGLHYYLVTPQPVATTEGKLGPGIDTRGAGGYVVGPGSVIDGKRYEVSKKKHPATAPAWYAEQTGKPTERPDGPGQVIELLDMKPARDRAIDYLKNAAPEATEGQSGDRTTYVVACKIAEFGISALTALELMWEHWNPIKAHPAWEYEALARKVDNAYKYKQTPTGDISPQADFDPVEEPPSAPTPTKSKKLYAIDFDNVELSTENPYLVKNVIDQEAMSVMYGASNSGKTFVMLDLAYHIATGREWHTRKVVKSGVVYVALEGGRGISKRLIALRRTYPTTEAVPLAVVPCPIDMLRPDGDIKELVGLIREKEKQFGIKVGLVVIDTLSRAMAGGNENAPDDMTMFVAHCDGLRNAVKAHLAIVHHTGKDKAKGARGHSSLLAATDTEIEIDESGIITFTKQRDIDKRQDPLGFTLKAITLGTDSDNDPITSCVVEAREVTAAEDFPHQKTLDLTAKEEEVKKAVIKAIKAGNGLASEEACMTYCDARRDKISSAKEKRDRLKVYQNAIEKMVGHGIFAQTETGFLALNPQTQKPG